MHSTKSELKFKSANLSRIWLWFKFIMVLVRGQLVESVFLCFESKHLRKSDQGRAAGVRPVKQLVVIQPPATSLILHIFVGKMFGSIHLLPNVCGREGINDLKAVNAS